MATSPAGTLAVGRLAVIVVASFLAAPAEAGARAAMTEGTSLCPFQHNLSYAK